MKRVYCNFFVLSFQQLENQQRIQRNEKPLPEEDINKLFKPLQPPPRLDSLLVTGQIDNYCSQMGDFISQSFGKLFMAESLQEKQSSSTTWYYLLLRKTLSGAIADFRKTYGKWAVLLWREATLKMAQRRLTLQGKHLPTGAHRSKCFPWRVNLHCTMDWNHKIHSDP